MAANPHEMEMVERLMAPDGRTIAFTSVTSLILAQLSGSEAVQFDTTRLVYLEIGRAHV